MSTQAYSGDERRQLSSNSRLFGASSGRIATPGHRWRQAATWMLGVAWLIDAALQYQPYMFTRAFPREVIAPAGDGNPTWISVPVNWSAMLMAHHIVVLNAMFATVQLLIGLSLFVRRTVKVALVASVVWSLMVWWLGEGLGGILTGAVLLYAVIAVLLWPGGTPDSHTVAV